MANPGRSLMSSPTPQGGSYSKPNKSIEAMRPIWTSEDSYATTLLLCFIDVYGTEGLEWDPMTIRSEIEDDFKVKVPARTFNKLMAGINLATTDQFYTNLPDFIDLCNILSGDILDPRWFDPADPGECAWGITEAMLISPPEKDDEHPFSQDIVAYISQVVKSHGIQNPPDVLKLGLREDADQIAENVAQSFSDDPEMYSAIWKVQQEKSDDIKMYVKENIRSMFAQVEQLKLNNGDVSTIMKRLINQG